MARKPVYAAGGVVIRDGARPLIAIVQRSKDERWVLPRGKLKRSENPRAGARREATEETGHHVRLHEFLGAITYRASGRPKVVQFWSMQASKRPSFDLMKDISTVAWLPLSAAILRLSYPLEKLFLRHVGRQALQRRTRNAPGRASKRKVKARRHKAQESVEVQVRHGQGKDQADPRAPHGDEAAPDYTLKSPTRHDKIFGPGPAASAPFPPGFLQKINVGNGFWRRFRRPIHPRFTPKAGTCRPVRALGARS